MPRGPSLGHTAYIPEKERYHVTKQQLLAMMDTMMGGRAAEELIFGADKITSGMLPSPMIGHQIKFQNQSHVIYPQVPAAI